MCSIVRNGANFPVGSFLIDAEHNGRGGRIDIETDDVADLGGELRIVGKLEGTDAVGRQAMSIPYALNRGQANARNLGH